MPHPFEAGNTPAIRYSATHPVARSLSPSLSDESSLRLVRNLNDAERALEFVKQTFSLGAGNLPHSSVWQSLGVSLFRKVVSTIDFSVSSIETCLQANTAFFLTTLIDLDGWLSIALISLAACYRLRNAFPNIKRSEKIINQLSGVFRLGNCGEQSVVASHYLKDLTNDAIEIFSIVNGDHAFLVIGRDRHSSESDYTTWGASAVVLDSWGDTFYPADNLGEKLNQTLVANGYNEFNANTQLLSVIGSTLPQNTQDKKQEPTLISTLCHTAGNVLITASASELMGVALRLMFDVSEPQAELTMQMTSLLIIAMSRAWGEAVTSLTYQCMGESLGLSKSSARLTALAFSGGKDILCTPKVSSLVGQFGIWAKDSVAAGVSRVLDNFRYNDDCSRLSQLYP